jgi:hypothetical protein
MRAHTLDDSRAYQPHYIDLLNIDSSVFQTFQRHPARSSIAIAHYLGLIDHIKEGIQEADAGADRQRMSEDKWREFVERMRDLLSDGEIEDMRKTHGPSDTGLAALGTCSPAAAEDVASRRPFFERAAVYDRSEVPRITLDERLASVEARGDTIQADGIRAALALASELGVSELAVTWNFPIAKVVFGYTREKHKPGESAIRGFRHQKYHEGKHPVYAVATETEALLVTLSARDALTFLHDRGEHPTVPADETEARRQLLDIFAQEEARPQPAHTLRVLVHTLSHLLLRGLDDGQVGFAEASLAEWLVPETLTFAIYANRLNDFTLGSLWTLLNNRVLGWLKGVALRTVHCDNDPICYQGDPRSCERCAYLTFGCRLFNDDLDRALLYDFLLRRGVLASATRSH